MIMIHLKIIIIHLQIFALHSQKIMIHLYSGYTWSMILYNQVYEKNTTAIAINF